MIVCCGEALIDMLPARLPDGRGTFLPVPGGAIFNTAIALGRLGQDAALVSGISTDMFGEQLMRALVASHVDCSLAIRSGRPTTLAFVKLVEGAATYCFYDENSAQRMVEPGFLPPLPARTRALHFGGISLISEPCGSAYEHAMMQAREKCFISIDPNPRPGFVTDEAAYRARLARMIANSDLVKVSDEDLDWLFPGQPFQTIADRWIAQGCALVVQTMGARGARARSSRFDVAVPAVAVEVVDTIGAGDAFNAGLLAALQESGRLSKALIATLPETEIETALTFASAVAADTVAHAGAHAP